MAPSVARADEYAWQSTDEVLGAMEKHGVPGVFFFDVPGETPAVSFAFQFNQGEVNQVLQKLKFACCRIVADTSGGGGGGGGRRGGKSKPKNNGWGANDRLAKELGVSSATQIVVCAFDKKVLGRRNDIVKREDFLQFLVKMAGENSARKKAMDEATSDLNQVEKWIEAKKLGDASRRLGMVLDKSDQVPKAIGERAKELESRLDSAGSDRLSEGKRLVDAGKLDEAEPILTDLVVAFPKADTGKDAKELLAKVKKEKEKRA